MKKAGQDAAKKLRFEEWIEESYDAAWDFAYDEAILEEVRGKEQQHDASLTPVELSAEYYATVKEVATARIVEAGFRLAKLIESLGL